MRKYYLSGILRFTQDLDSYYINFDLKSKAHRVRSISKARNMLKIFPLVWMIKLKSKHTSLKKFNIQHSSSVLFHSCIQADRKLCSSLPQQLVFLFWFPMLLSQFTAWGNLSQPQAKALAAFSKNKAISKIAKLCNYGFCVLDCQTFLDKEIKKIENSKAHCTRAFSKSRIIWKKIEPYAMSCVCLRADHCGGGVYLDSGSDRIELVTF